MCKSAANRVSALFLLAVCGLLPLTPAAAQNFALDFNHHYVDIPYIGTGVDFTEISLEAYVYWRGHRSTDGAGLIEGRGSTLHWQINLNNNVRIRFEGVDQNADANMQENEWTHLAASYSRTTRQLQMLKNGEVFHTFSGDSGTNTFWTSGDGQIGDSLATGDRGWDGLIDEFRIWNKARTQEQIQENMNVELFGTEEGLIAYWKFNEGEGTTAFDSGPNGHDGTIVGATWTTDAAPVMPLGFAYNPVPAHGGDDVPRDVALSWTPGKDMAAHDVYFGQDRAAVEAADTANPLGVLVSQGQTALTYAPADLQYGQTYYWRVDGTDATGAVASKGRVWSFTVEPYAYPIRNVTATAASFQAGMGPENAVNGAGLDAADQHATEGTQMWLSSGAQPNWILFEFDAVHKLQELWVWNSNQMIETFVGFGAKDVTIEYSADGETWTVLDDVPEFARAPGSATYAANTTVDFGGVMARLVRLTINSSWGGLPQAGLSEVRFSSVPVQAREPVPATAATGVDLDATLTWRAGRQAVSHTVYFSQDMDAVANGTAPAESLTDNDFRPGTLDFGTTYYWKVDEVGDADTQAGEVWSFTTQEYAVVDDFESYNDDDNRIYDTWLDGWVNSTGSQVGYEVSPFAEKAIVHGGEQSMPFLYDNENAPFYSEAEREFSTVQNWTVNGADTLVVNVRGQAAGFLEQADGRILMGGGGADIWGTADQFRFAAKPLNGNGSIVARVERLVRADGWTKVGVMIRENLQPGSRFAAVYATPDYGVRFQARLANAGDATSDSAIATPDQIAHTAPVWIKLERTGNDFKAYYSADGTTWTAMAWNPQSIAMPGSVYIGLAVTSHSATAMTTAEFSNVTITGASGAWEVAEIGVAQPSNAPEMLYVAIEDSTGKRAVVSHPDRAITVATAWQSWPIPLSDFGGVNLSRVKKMTLGVGSPTSPVKGGAGILYIDDIGFGRPASGQ